MIQFTDTALDAALAPGQERTIRPLLQVDWLKNDTFTGAACQLNSDNLIQVDCVDDVDSGLPDEVNGRPTASSTTLTAVLHGYVDDVPLWRLFSPWNRDSVYHGMTMEGAAVKYSTSTATQGGSTETRRFTGWIDSVQVDRSAGTVTVVAKNNLHLLGNMVSLPRWARATDVYGFEGLPHVDRFDIPNEDRMENAPLSAAYLFQNVLRQCKAVPGPDPRGSAIWFSSGYGGLIPELGSLSDMDAAGYNMSQGVSQYVYPQNWGFPNYNRDIPSFGEFGFPSPYHAPSQSSGASSDIFDTYSQSATTLEFKPTSFYPKFVNGGLWVRISSGDSGAFVNQIMCLEPNWVGLQADTARVELNVGASNTTLKVQSTASGSSRTFTCSTPTTKDQLIYVSWEADMSSANGKIWYNDVQQSTSTSGALTGYPTLSGVPGSATPGIQYRNKARVWCRGQAGFANAELWLQSATSVAPRVPTWANTSYGRKDFAFINGGFLGAQVYLTDAINNQNWAEGAGTMPAVTHIPVRDNVDAWELLKEMCAAFNFTMWIDAYGGLRIIPQGVLDLLEMRLTDPRKELDGDSLQGIRLTSAYDTVRDRIAYGGQTARRFWSSVYSAPDARTFSAPAGQTVEYSVPFPVDMISMSAVKESMNRGGLGGGGVEYGVDQNRWQGFGFQASKENGDAGTTTSVWPVFLYPINVGGSPNTFGLRLTNAYSSKVYLALATGIGGAGSISSPGLLVKGALKVRDNLQTLYQGSGNRLLSLPVSEFHSAPWTMQKTIAALLKRASTSVPRAEDLTVPGDPRREVLDALTLRDPDGEVAYLIAQITGRADTWSSGEGYSQTLTIRVLAIPGTWLMEIDGFTEADETTYFG